MAACNQRQASIHFATIRRDLRRQGPVRCAPDTVNLRISTEAFGHFIVLSGFDVILVYSYNMRLPMSVAFTLILLFKILFLPITDLCV